MKSQMVLFRIGDPYLRVPFDLKFAYQNITHTSIECSPFYADYEYNPKMDISIENDTIEGEIPAAKERVQKLLQLREDLSKR